MSPRVVIQRAEKRHALNVIPMEVRNENVSVKLAIAEFVFQLVAQHAEAGTAIENVNALSQANLDARGVAPVTQILGLWRGRRTTYAPKLDPHRFGWISLSNLGRRGSFRQLDWWFAGVTSETADSVRVLDFEPFVAQPNHHKVVANPHEGLLDASGDEAVVADSVLVAAGSAGIGQA